MANCPGATSLLVYDQSGIPLRDASLVLGIGVCVWGVTPLSELLKFSEHRHPFMEGPRQGRMSSPSKPLLPASPLPVSCWTLKALL